jgi:hypothetical protein
MSEAYGSLHVRESVWRRPEEGGGHEVQMRGGGHEVRVLESAGMNVFFGSVNHSS